MSKSMQAWVGVVMACVSCATACAAVEVTAVRIDESRSVQLVEEHLKFPVKNEVRVHLQLSGPEAQSAVRYGKLHITEAVDDLGQSMVPREKDPFGAADAYKVFDNDFFRRNVTGKAQADPPKIEVKLDLPLRKATKITRVKGEFKLLDLGTVQTVEVRAVEVAGKPVDSTDLAKAGVKLVLRAKLGESLVGRQSIDIEIIGDASAVETLEVLDQAEGKVISSNTGSFRFGDSPETRSLSLQKPMDAQMMLRIKISVDRKVTDVPFELRDIPLR